VIHRILLAAFSLTYFITSGCAQGLNGSDDAPQPNREFRGVWVATVVNIDWPSKKGLSVEEQQKEMRAILDRCVALNLNAVVFQVRTSGDAFYKSDLEPWSEYLTGTQGKAPEPFYDPLEMWIKESHARGLELHAWFNPYRARHPDAKTPEADTHIAKTNPNVVKKYGGFLWLDPGEPAASEHTIKVFRDVVKRYDIDGVHIDDYFYPYPIKGIEFPDDPSWQRYQQTGGKLTRADWRRDNVNKLIEKIYAAIKDEKPHVKFGISPFGIWQPGHPPSVQGFNQHEQLYADAKLWLNKGWVDYYTPQLYWRITATTQPYKDLLDWWIGENKRARHIWPGLAPYRVRNRQQNWPPEEIAEQIEATRARYPKASGHIHFSMKSLQNEENGLAKLLRAGVYKDEALVPASKWLDDEPPPVPTVATTTSGDSINLSMTSRAKGKELWLWSIYTKRAGKWTHDVHPASNANISIKSADLEAISVAGVDRVGNESRRRNVPLTKDKP
jgi:uncharacterized lipoprotein YddW (UPF0748 family)